MFIQNALTYGDITSLAAVRAYLTSIESELIRENIKIYVFDEDHHDINNWLSVYQLMRQAFRNPKLMEYCTLDTLRKDYYMKIVKNTTNSFIIKSMARDVFEQNVLPFG